MISSTKHPAPSTQHLALWGGIECTVNRVGDVWHDQYAHSGHDDRIDDLDRIAALGIRTLRYGLLWERIAQDGIAHADWRWADERLGRLRDLGVRPIAGLVHHGSGPADTHLLDPAFPEKLAAYARAVAERYPWLDAWTPVNEPFTTARFSALYGHWYPHARDERACMTALLHQCRATVLAMEQVRAVNPAATLIQTEDFGKTHGTDRTSIQVDFENERRWLTFDLLLGRVTPDHWMWRHLSWLGIPEADLAFFVDRPCPPDVLGINTYLTSERFLDHRLEHYPERLHGGNGWLRYADVEAVRVLRDGVVGSAGLLEETWDRYGLPMAITEAHLGCSREDQVRWLAETWTAALAAREGGAEVRAVTVWSLLGAHDWHCLLTRRDGHYEPGAFDLRGPRPRLTAVGRMAAALAGGEAPDHPLLADPGWWRRPERLLYPPWPPTTPDDDHAAEPAAPPAARRFGVAPQPLLVLGADEAFGLEVVASCAARGIRVAIADGAGADAGALDDALAETHPWAVVDARLRRQGEDPDGAAAAGITIDIDGVAALAAACAAHDLPLLALSSALVFDGGKGAPYLESDPVAPFEVVGRAHADLEAAVTAAHPGGLVVRTGAPFSATGGDPALAAALAALADGARVAADDRAARSVAWLPDLVHAALDLLIDGESGLWHLAHPEPVTPADLLRGLAVRLGHDPRKVVPLARGDRAGAALPAPLPAGAALGSERGLLLPGVGSALARLAAA